MNILSQRRIISLLMVAGFAFLAGGPAWAHCDTLDGPVVRDARIALERQDVQPVLKWVGAEDEEVIVRAFEHALEVRELSDAARELADTYFFETLVRIHREWEGAPYTGLKPAGSPVEPGVAASDAAIESGNVDTVVRHLTHALEEGIRTRFQRVHEAHGHAEESVAAGREFVAAYVDFTHFVVGMLHAIEGHAGHHSENTSHGSGHHGGGHEG